MKGHILFIVLLFAMLGIGLYVGMLVKDREWQKKIESMKPTTTIEERYTPRPEEKKEVKQPPKPPTKEHRQSADSSFDARLRQGIDSIKAHYAQITAPRETTIVFNTGDTLIHQSQPLRMIDIYTFIPAPQKETIRTDSIPYPVEVPVFKNETSLLEDAACASIGAGAGVLLAGPIGAVVGAPVAVMLYRWLN